MMFDRLDAASLNAAKVSPASKDPGRPKRSCLAGLAALWLLSSPAFGGIAGATADGTWDCKTDVGADIGTIIIVEKNYAFVKLDGRVGGYGKLFQVGQDQFDLPHYVLIDGYMKDEMRVIGVGMTGPKENEHDLSGELFLVMIFSETDTPYCRRRVTPAG
jgi:hypothetical protein